MEIEVAEEAREMPPTWVERIVWYLTQVCNFIWRLCYPLNGVEAAPLANHGGTLSAGPLMSADKVGLELAEAYAYYQQNRTLVSNLPQTTGGTNVWSPW